LLIRPHRGEFHSRLPAEINILATKLEQFVGRGAVFGVKSPNGVRIQGLSALLGHRYTVAAKPTFLQWRVRALNRTLRAIFLLRASAVETRAWHYYRQRMTLDSLRTIRIAAALIDDGMGHLLLVRKAGTQWFMQAGGKMEEGESALCALQRELSEEIGLSLANSAARHLGQFSAIAANEPGHIVEADVFHVRAPQHVPRKNAEIEEVVWVTFSEAASMPLAPLTRDHILPLALSL